jgi:hypothetical protein
LIQEKERLQRAAEPHSEAALAEAVAALEKIPRPVELPAVAASKKAAVPPQVTEPPVLEPVVTEEMDVSTRQSRGEVIA